MINIHLLRPLLLQGLLNVEFPSDNFDFKKWVASGNYIVRDVPTCKSIDIEINNEHIFHNMVAFDVCRMASAAFETMENIKIVPSLPKSIGWVAIKAYYAAFFSAHSIMRFFGHICSQIERGHVNQLNSYALAVGITNQIRPESGFYWASYSPTARNLILKKMLNTHEDTWKVLTECLQEISIKALKGTGLKSHQQKLSADLDELILKLTDKGRLSNGSYLSQYRNAVNYRQEHCSWHPYGKQSVKSEKAIRVLSSWQKEDDVPPTVWKESLDSYRFFTTCRDVVNLNYLLIQLIIKNCGSRSNIYTRWPNKLLSMAVAA